MFSKNRSHLLAVCNSVADQLWPSLKPTVRRKYQLLRRRCYSSEAGILLRSDYGAVAVPQLSVPQFIWRDCEKWGDKPMVVRRRFSSIVSHLLPQPLCWPTSTLWPYSRTPPTPPNSWLRNGVGSRALKINVYTDELNSGLNPKSRRYWVGL